MDSIEQPHWRLRMSGWPQTTIRKLSFYFLCGAKTMRKTYIMSPCFLRLKNSAVVRAALIAEEIPR